MVRELARRSCAFYASQYLSGPPEAPYNGRFLVAEHHQAWSELLATSDRICVLAPRDHGKSHFFSLAYPIWMIERHPKRYGMIFSATQPQASKILETILAEIEGNPKLRHLVPAKKSKWSATQARFANGHTIYARGYGSKVRGAHPIWIACDDVLNDEDGYSEVKRRRNIDYFQTAVTNMIIPGGQIVVVGTPFHQSDLYSVLANNDEYMYRRYQAIKPDGRALWADRYSLTWLKKRQVEIGTVKFAREFQCSPVSDGSSLFPSTLLSGPDVLRDDLVIGHDWVWWEREHGLDRRFIGVDFARSANTGADYTVVFVVGIDKLGNHYVLDIIRDHGLDFQTQLELIKRAGAKYNPDIIACESNQMQAIFGDELIRTTDLPIKNIHTGEEKHSLEKGVPGLRVLFENRKVRIPRGDVRTRETTDIWLEELRNQTFFQGKVQCVGDHDDTVMAWFICEKAVRSGMFSFSFEATPEDEAAYRTEMGLEQGLTEEQLIHRAVSDGAFQTGDPHLDAPIIGSIRRPGGHHALKARLVQPHELAIADHGVGGQLRPSKQAELRPTREVLAPGGSPTAADMIGGFWGI